MESVISSREEVERFLSVPPLIDFRGIGYGEGCSGGYGYGSGDICGEGSEYDDGFGEGYYDGFMRCFIYGIGYGEGGSCGYGSEYGSGYGYISGINDKNIKALNGNLVDYIDNLPTIITQVRGNIARGYIIENSLTLSPCIIAKVGNSFVHGGTIKEVVADAERKELENIPIEERIKKFVETFGSLDSEHKGKEFYDWHNILTGSCRMGRDIFCKAHNIALEKMYSVRHFLDITKESYGSDVINLLRKAYKIS